MCSRTRCASHNTHPNLKFGYKEPYKVEVYKNEWVRNIGEFLFPKCRRSDFYSTEGFDILKRFLSNKTLVLVGTVFMALWSFVISTSQMCKNRK